MVKGGPSVNPRGRPRKGESLSERVRERVDPDELIERWTTILRDPVANLREVLQASQLLASYGWGKPEATINTRRLGDEGLPYPAEWGSLPPGSRTAWLLAQRALLLKEGS